MDTCYRCHKEATLKLNKMQLGLCSYCANVLVSELHDMQPMLFHGPAIVREPSKEIAVIPLQPKVVPATHAKRKNRKRRLAPFYAFGAAMLITVFITAALVIHSAGWAFFVQRSAGVGGTPEDSKVTEQIHHPSPSPIPTLKQSSSPRPVVTPNPTPVTVMTPMPKG